MRTFILFIFLVIANVFCEETGVYKVKKGDSFYTIARKMKINYIELAKLNGNRPLVAGKIIKIPSYKLYKVVPGDNIHRISSKLKIPIKKLVKLNGDISSIKAGQLLKIPQSANKPKRQNDIALKKIKDEEIHIKEKDGLDFIWPASGNLVLKYETYDSIMHYGLRLKLKKKNILSTEKGIVAYVGKMRGLGNTLVISHANGVISLYAGLKHCQKEVGKSVVRGEIIGAGEDILFFSLYEKGSPINPALIIH